MLLTNVCIVIIVLYAYVSTDFCFYMKVLLLLYESDTFISLNRNFAILTG